MGISEHEIASDLRHYGTPHDNFFGQEEKARRYTESLDAARGAGLGDTARPVQDYSPPPVACKTCPLNALSLSAIFRLAEYRNGGISGVSRAVGRSAMAVRQPGSFNGFYDDQFKKKF